MLNVLTKSFKGRIVAPTVMILVTLLAAISFFMSARFSSFSNSLVEGRLKTGSNGLSLFLETSQSNSQAAAISMALNIDAISAIKKRDRDDIIKIFNPSLKLYKIDFFTITDENGIVLASTHESDKYGDSLLKQQSIKDAISGKIRTYYENNNSSEIALHTAAPVFDSGEKLIGLVSAGVRFDNNKTIDYLKDFLKSDVTVFLGDSRIASTISQAEEQVIGTKLDFEIAKTIFEDKKEFHGDAVIFDKKYKIMYRPLLNYRNEAFAVIALAIPLEEILAESQSIIRDGIFIGLLGLVIAIVALYLIISTISEPVVVMSRHMNAVANGNLSVKIEIDRADEVGLLGKSLRKVVHIIRRLITDINTMIAEQRKGNIDYTLNTEEFHGDYKTLASNILELADLGMRDQLTGLPNRRSFDNRMELEWSRATREKASIAVLMLDADNFKVYNDTFGHQQGDVALKSLASTLKQAIKRSLDLAARWGGEEFIVLLPGTDVNGALSVAEQLRATIEKTAIQSADPKASRITVSIGVHVHSPTKNCKISDMLSKVDGALYQAKALGRNRVVQYEDFARREDG